MDSLQEAYSSCLRASSFEAFHQERHTKSVTMAATTKPIFYRQNGINVQNFNSHLSSAMTAISLGPLPDMQPQNVNACFLQVIIRICFGRTAPDNSSSVISLFNVGSRCNSLHS